MSMRVLAWILAVSALLIHQALQPIGLYADIVLVGVTVLLALAGYFTPGATLLVSGAVVSDAAALAPYPVATLSSVVLLWLWLPVVLPKVHSAFGRITTLLLSTVAWYLSRIVWYVVSRRGSTTQFTLVEEPYGIIMAGGALVVAWLIYEGLVRRRQAHHPPNNPVHATST